MPEDAYGYDRRALIAGLGMMSLSFSPLRALAGPSERSADKPLPEIENAPVRRPWADFEAARAVAKDANTSEMAKAYLLSVLGPLPWRFFGDVEGYDVTVDALVDLENDPYEAVGVFALASAVHPTDPENHPRRVILLLCGRVSVRQKIAWRDEMDEFLSGPLGVPFDLTPRRQHKFVTIPFAMPNR